ncbi:endonuclease/exonuclease/phosphatase family protein [Roseivivax sp. THAF30]|uniref:endonuclease/exonuclease/phosphatase family protein n=1 Tax=Roseivivax sp. THAF30 TaxID=2587852 RepID=UPI001269126F|nr:endonuclease/exonuclease/phosphatase family protein [Roseivivax sp. THAF30]QFT63792.1 Endonuclease/Exonuclease/phosphatase family protein [Roseivivax sp. THAF30]
MAQFSLATFNLYQYAAPGTYWYDRESGNSNSEAKWALKQDFILRTLADLDADIVGFQEVFSRVEFRALATAAGYPNVVFGGDPAFETEEDGTVVWQGPVVALASRFPILSAGPLAADPSVEPDGLLAPDFDFRRQIIEAEIEVPGLAQPLVVYCAHLKSQGAFVDRDRVAAFGGWSERFRDHLSQRAQADASQVIRRAGEAIMLYEAAMKRMATDRDLPLAVLGDLNDEPGSFTLRILTQNEDVPYIAGTRYQALDNSEKSNRYTWQLYSTAGLGAPQGLGLTPTHVGWMHASVLDYVLVSNGLNRRNPRGPVADTTYDVFNSHHWDPESDSKETSDHAPVRAIFELKSEA